MEKEEEKKEKEKNDTIPCLSLRDRLVTDTVAPSSDHEPFIPHCQNNLSSAISGRRWKSNWWPIHDPG